jgi:hypothetical protein
LLAAAALLGVSGAAEAKQTVIKHQLVQQNNPSATSQGGASSQQGGQAQMGQAGNPVAGQLPQGVTPKDYGNTRDDVRDTFSALTKAALNRDSFNDLRDQLVKADRDRLATNDNKYPDDLNRAIDQFDQAWKGKYNASFSVDKNDVFTDQFLAVTTGEVTNPQQVSHWPIAPRQGEMQAQTSNPTMNQGTGVAVATFTGQPGQPPLHVSLVREGNDWKIDIPDTVTADQLKSSLVQHLNEVTNMQNQWPQDRYQAQRIVASHILMALYNLPAGQGGQQPQSQSSMGQGQQQGQQTQQQQHQGQQPQASQQSQTSQQPQSSQQQQHQGQQPQSSQQHQGQQPQSQSSQSQSSLQPQSSQSPSTTSQNPKTSATQSQSSSQEQNPEEQSESEE